MMMMMMTMMMMMDDDDILAPKGCAEGLQPKSHHPGVSNQQKHQPAKAGPESRPTQSPSRGTSQKPESWWTGLGPGQGPGYGLEFCSNETERKTQSASQSAPKKKPVRYHGAKKRPGWRVKQVAPRIEKGKKVVWVRSLRVAPIVACKVR